MEKIAKLARISDNIEKPIYHHVLPDIIKSNGYKTGIEIGVCYANHAENILINSSLELLVGIDPYKLYPQQPGLESQEDFDQLFLFVNERMKKWGNRFKLIMKSSLEAYKQLSNHQFDFVFIDGNHTEEDVFNECNLFSAIIKQGGMLLGHDYNIFEGVTKAVNRFGVIIEKEVITFDGSIWGFNLV